LNAQSVKDVTTLLLKIKDFIPAEWNLKNIAGGIENILFIKKQGKIITSVAQLARAAVSKTAGWGFDSLLTCY
jgi:hypothetical protein